MNYSIINGNLLETSCPILVQQSNCLTMYGKGLALALSKKFSYADLYGKRTSVGGKNLATKDTRGVPGTLEVLKDPTGKGPQIACLLAQWAPGKGKYRYPGPYKDTKDDRLQWFSSGLLKLAEYMETEGLVEVAFPYKIGCGLAGGDWKLYEALLVRFAEDTGFETKVYKL